MPLECEDILELCENGMHGSVRLIDALHYASGPIVCRVEIGGDVIEGDDKLCGRRRTVLWMLDSTQILHEFASGCAEDALALVDAPDPRCVEAIAAKRKWLNGEITDEELDAASVAAWAAASTASRAVVWAARAAARAASRAAVLAAGNAAWDAADAAALAAARWAANAAAADARAAAWAVARNAEWAAARAKQNARLTEMVMKAYEKEDE